MESISYKLPWNSPRNHSVHFHVYSYGINEEMPPGRYKRQQDSLEWLFIYFHDPAEVVIDHARKHLESGSLMIWSPGTRPHYGNENTRWTHSWLQCTGTEIPQLLRENGFAPFQPVHMPRPILVEQYLMRVFREVSAHHKPNQRLLQNIFQNWMIEMSRVVQGIGSDHPPPPESLESTKRYIDLHVAEKLSLTQMARMSHLSVSHFSTLFRHYYNTSPIDYLVHRRMEYAQHLLDAPGLSVTQIAERIGYTDLYQFSRMFKKRFGKSPSAYRKGLHS